jgi:hypothetical protein
MSAKPAVRRSPEGGEADLAVGQDPFAGAARFEHGPADDALHGDAVDGVEGERSLSDAAAARSLIEPGSQLHLVAAPPASVMTVEASPDRAGSPGTPQSPLLQPVLG